MNPVDREQLESRYWRYSLAGIPIPGFVDSIGAGDGEIHEIYRHLLKAWRSRPDSERVLLPDTLEAEHRRRPIVSVVDLGAAAARIAAPDYDLALARAVANGRLQAQRARDLAETARHQAWWSETIEAQRELERIRKNLPSGREANMDLIRTTLKLDRRVGS
ncbi:MAG: hypothetical protein H7232_07750 [Aeromicrobium sp.]|nr:hypothetical protein [Burkholderiales bacterium]